MVRKEVNSVLRKEVNSVVRKEGRKECGKEGRGHRMIMTRTWSKRKPVK